MYASIILIALVALNPFLLAEPPRWVVVILASDAECWDGLMVERVQSYILTIETGFESYVTYDGMEVFCMGGASLQTLDKATVPLLRSIFANERLLFIYGADDDLISLASRNGYRIDDSAAGIAFIKHGYALAQYMAGGTMFNFAYSMDHEMTHIEGCLEHRDSWDPVEEWYISRHARTSAFC